MRNMNRRAGILIVDAEEEWRTAVVEALRPLGCDLFVTNSGEEALEQLADHPIAIALIGLDLPGIDGLAVVKKIERERPDVRVFVLARGADPSEIEESVRHGALDVFRKPVPAEGIRSVVRAALKREDDGPSPGE